MIRLVRRFLSERSPVRIVVLGDLLLDEHWDTAVSRLAPEAPIPVMLSDHRPPRRLPGGAGNVVRQLLSLAPLGIRPYLIAPSDRAADHCDPSTIPKSFFDHCPFMARGRVPIKRRFYEGSRLLARHDVQEANFGESDLTDLRQELWYRVKALVSLGVDLLIISDYDAGALDADLIGKVIDACRVRNIPVVVDPKRRPFAEWTGCTAIKLNRAELNGHTPEEVLDLAGAECVVVTRGKDPPFVVSTTQEASQNYPHFEGVTPQSVSGAGDCFLAWFAAARARGFSWSECADLGHLAGQYYVGGRHNNPVRPRDIMVAADDVESKIIGSDSWPEAVCGGGRLRVVVANGCFDVALTTGHIRTLNWAAAQGDILVVGVNSDASVRRLKGDLRPRDSVNERAMRVASLGCVDWVCVFEEDTPVELIRHLEADVVVKGHDYEGQDVPGSELCEVRIAPDFGSAVHSSNLVTGAGSCV